MSRSVGGFSNSGHLSLRAVVQSCLFEANSYLRSCKFARNNDPLGGDFRVQFRPPSYLHANCAMPARRECALERIRGAHMRKKPVGAAGKPGMIWGAVAQAASAIACWLAFQFH